MTVFSMETYVVKPDKLSEFTAFVKNYEAYMKKRPELFKELKSHKVFSHLLGGNWGGGAWMGEYENLADLEKNFNKLMGDKEFMTKMFPEWNALIVPGTYSINVWTPVP
ncbi:MAG TPA: hypothetical protein VMT42_07920 [candidate division Zixibacteria bacterium]|nr:hypothetical protein [candidate division Zixibacteria bacterium]